MANLYCDYYYKPYPMNVGTPPSVIKVVEALVGGVFYDVTITATTAFPDYAGVAQDVQDSIIAAGVPGETGTWHFDVIDNYLHAWVTGVNFENDNIACASSILDDAYGVIFMDEGGLEISCPDDGYGTTCYENVGTGICETCHELIYDGCENYITVNATGLEVDTNYYFYIKDKFNHRYTITPNSTTSTEIVLSVDELRSIRGVSLNPYSGSYEFSLTTDSVNNTKETIQINGVNYKCLILKFKEEN